MSSLESSSLRAVGLSKWFQSDKGPRFDAVKDLSFSLQPRRIGRVSRAEWGRQKHND